MKISQERNIFFGWSLNLTQRRPTKLISAALQLPLEIDNLDENQQNH
jgi:hypothetical protein